MYENPGDGRLVLSATDLVGYLACEHLTALSRDAMRRLIDRPEVHDNDVTVVQRRGHEHELAYLEDLRKSRRSVIDIDGGTPAEGAEQTRMALAAGPAVIYQATFFDGDGADILWLGYSDFLSRVELPSALGSFSYEPEDTKLARQVRPSAIVQLCQYADQLARVQGVTPAQIHVVLGGKQRTSFRLAEFSSYFRSAKHQFLEFVGSTMPTYPVPVEHCNVCAWRNVCDERRIADDHLSLVPGLTGEQVRKLAASAGITSVTTLASFSGNSVRGIGTATLERLRAQARLQVRARETGNGPPPFELLSDAGPGIGLGALPEPTPDDLFFDIEGDPYVGEGGLEYLLGVAWLGRDGDFEYRAFWAHTEAEEKASFEAFIDFVTERRRKNPDLHIYHYATYERTALGRLMGRYGTREAEVDALFRGDVLVDLYQVVRQSVRVGTPSYSLKKLEALYGVARTEAITDAGSSIEEYERYLETGEAEILSDLEAYNKVDCVSTAGLRSWLEARRDDYRAEFALDPGRSRFAVEEPSESVASEDAESTAVRAQLAALATRSTAEEAAALGLLGDLLEWHRREDRPAYWAFFHRVFDCDENDLFDDSEAIAGLEYLDTGEEVRRSIVHRYRFDPTQDFKLRVGDTPRDPEVERRRRIDKEHLPDPGTIYSLDPVLGELGLLLAKSSTAAKPRSLIPQPPYDTKEHRQALRRLARPVIEAGTLDADAPFRAARDLLLRRPPRLRGVADGSRLVHEGELGDDAAVRLAAALDGGTLAIQGPPGSGKTRTAARIAVALVESGKTVGITANSHSVISNLLRAIMVEAERRSVPVKASQKSDGSQGFKHPAVAQRTRNKAILDDLAAGTNVVAGTSWLFSPEELDGRLDYLIVDEAGQLSLANTLAVATAARNLVLVGDPRQLSQPSKGSHPPGAGTSALEHLLNGRDTMPDDRGLFLETTYRLHPDICSFISEIVYDGRLTPETSCELHSLGGSGPLSGSGLRWLPVEHAGNRVSSSEEAEAARLVFDDLLGRKFTRRDGTTKDVALEDILVVAPYNAQVAALGKALPKDARIGTVDKFQGQEAPVVIVSLATSDLAEIPRGMEFLYSRNRLNVAVSRAQALTVLIASPALLRVRCHTVEQLRLANELCRYVELAHETT
jgi:uncharacterized protein